MREGVDAFPEPPYNTSMGERAKRKTYKHKRTEDPLEDLFSGQEKRIIQKALEVGLSAAGEAAWYLEGQCAVIAPRYLQRRWHLHWALALVEKDILYAPQVQSCDRALLWPGPVLDKVEWYFPKSVVLWGCKEYVRRQSQEV